MSRKNSTRISFSQVETSCTGLMLNKWWERSEKLVLPISRSKECRSVLLPRGSTWGGSEEALWLLCRLSRATGSVLRSGKSWELLFWSASATDLYKNIVFYFYFMLPKYVKKLLEELTLSPHNTNRLQTALAKIDQTSNLNLVNYTAGVCKILLKISEHLGSEE